MRREESEKDKVNSDFLERNTEVDGMTIRSMAAKNIQKISGKP